MANYYCVYCGSKFTNVASLTSGWCVKHPAGINSGRHVLYEGSEKDRYTCKYCGLQAPSIIALVSTWCVKHPDGINAGKHTPSL